MNNRDFENLIHRRLLARDPVATSELVEAYIEPLVRQLAYRFTKLDDPHLVRDAVIDALLKYIENPERFDPERGKLSAYLLMSARGDLLNKLKSEQRRRLREVHVDNVELQPHLRNTLIEDGESTRLPFGLTMADIEAHVEQIITDQRDRQILELILDGERKTEHYSQILGITDLNIRDQRQQVKRAKDRLVKKLRRLGKRLDESK